MARGGPERPPNHVIVLYGATGDLARRKIIPGLFHLASLGLMPERYRIVGVSRGSLSDDEMRATALLALQMFAPEMRWQKLTRSARRIRFGPNICSARSAVARISSSESEPRETPTIR